MNLKVSDAKREDGFTLIELLVVVIIIGILAAIAIPVFLNQREKARDSAVQSTLRSSATYQEIVFTEGTAYAPATAAGVDALEAEGFRPGSDITFSIDFSGATGYCHEAVHADGPATRVWAISSVVSEAGAPELGTCSATGTVTAP